MKLIEAKTYISEEIFNNEYQFMYGNRKSEMVTFIYTNIKTGKEIEKHFTYKEAIELARDRRKDGRYKNYEFYIA